MPRKIRASKDEETQPPLTQRPGFIIGMTFLAVVAAVIISVLIFRFIRRRKAAAEYLSNEQLEQQAAAEHLSPEQLQQLQAQFKERDNQPPWENKIRINNPVDFPRKVYDDEKRTIILTLNPKGQTETHYIKK